MADSLCAILILLIACGTILYTCGYSSRLLFRLGDESRPRGLGVFPPKPEVLGAGDVIAMVVWCSFVLVIFFFFLKYIRPFFSLLISVYSFVCVAKVLLDWFLILLPHFLPTLLSYAVSLLVVVTYWRTHHWLVGDLICFCFSVLFPSAVRVSTFSVVICIAVALLVYDVWWVFLSPLVFGKSVMMAVAVSAGPSLPILFGVYAGDSRMMLGMGDVALPGLLLDFFLRFDTARGSSLFPVAFGGYMVGLVASFVAMVLMRTGQPALLWIFPAVLLPVAFVARQQNVMTDLWNFGKKPPIVETVRMDDDEEEP